MPLKSHSNYLQSQMKMSALPFSTGIIKRHYCAIYRLGQKVCLDFPVTSYEKPEQTFRPAQYFQLLFSVTPAHNFRNLNQSPLSKRTEWRTGRLQGHRLSGFSI